MSGKCQKIERSLLAKPFFVWFSFANKAFVVRILQNVEIIIRNWSMRLGLEHIMLFSKGTTLHFDNQSAHFFQRKCTATHCDKEGAHRSMLLPRMKHSTGSS